MSTMIESLSVIDNPERYLDATLYSTDEIALHVEDAETAVDVRYSLDEIRTIVATLGHLLYVADLPQTYEP